MFRPQKNGFFTAFFLPQCSSVYLKLPGAEILKASTIACDQCASITAHRLLRKVKVLTCDHTSSAAATTRNDDEYDVVRGTLPRNHPNPHMCSLAMSQFGNEPSGASGL